MEITRGILPLTPSWRRSLSYSNQSIDRYIRHERDKFEDILKNNNKGINGEKVLHTETWQ